MKFKEFLQGPEEKKLEEPDKLSVEEWLNELTDGKGLNEERVYIIVGSFINKLKK